MPLGTIAQFPFGGALTAANLNAPVNSLKTLVDAFVDSQPTTYQAKSDMTVVATASKGVLRDTDGSIKAAGSSVLAALQTTGALVGLSTATFSGNIQSGGVFIAGSGSRTITTADGHLDAAQLTNSVLFATIIADYKPGTSASAGQINVAAGGAYADSSGNIVGPLAAQAAPLSNAGSASQPAGANSQQVVISLAPSTGAPVATGGTVGTSPSTPAAPTGNRPVALVLWRGTTANPSGIVAAADITDLRGGGGGGGGAGGSGGGAPTTAQYWISGTNGSLSNALDSTNSATNARIHTNLLRDVATDASLFDALLSNLQDDLLSRIIVTSGGAGVQVLASADGTSPGPVTLSIGGKKRKITAIIGTVPQAGGSGPRYLIADCNSPGTGPTWSLVNPMPGPSQPSLTQYQRVIGTMWYDSTSALLRTNTAVDHAMIAGVGSSNVRAETVTNVGTSGAPTITGTSAFQAIPNVPTTTFYLPKAATCIVIAEAAWVATATQTNSQIGTFFDGTYHEPSSIFVPGYATPTGVEKRASVGLVTLGAGLHTVTQQAYVTTGNSLVLSTAYCQVTVIVLQ